jgi:hypothetical protein
VIVPDNTIAVIPIKGDEKYKPFDMSKLNLFLKPLKHLRKRDWFDKDFYKCLPLSIGNTQGFAVSIPFDFDVFWNGGNRPEDLFFKFYEDEKVFNKEINIILNSHFGYGIFTIHLPVMLKTPPGVNLMTIAAPNFPAFGLSPLTGVVESDNLRYTFTLNVKVDVSNVWIKVQSGYPLIGILPIPRYFCDQFSLVNAYDIFDKNDIEEERKVCSENAVVDSFLRFNNHNKWWDGCYFDGTDIRGNKFNDHQMPNNWNKK